MQLPLRKPAGSKQQIAEAIRDGRRASQRITALRCGQNDLEAINSQILSDKTKSISRTSERGTSSTSLLERDFTVQGKKGGLQCPFTSMTNSKRLDSANISPRHSDLISNLSSHKFKSGHQTSPSDGKDVAHHGLADPICAALHAETHLLPPLVTASASKCPIRYMDQHSPEEIARYFESHKHEIPRSHEICVKRYQRNEEDIRKLDAKYDNLASLIAWLSEMHKRILAGEEIAEASETERTQSERVETWAKAVTAEDVEDTEVAILLDEEREGHFDRPMKEVRVGESPTRPWGIPVPFGGQSGLLSSDPQRHASPAIPIRVTTASAPKSEREFSSHHSHKPKEELHADSPSQSAFFHASDVAQISKDGQPKMIFTGPVFIGYPIEQAVTLVREWKTAMPKSKGS